MATALHLPYHPRDTETAWKTLLPTLTKPDHYHLNLVTKMYLQKSLNVKKDFRTNGKKVFQADTESVNFASPAEVAKSINDSVRKQTGEKIQNLVDGNVLTRDTKMVLLSAAFFKSGWLKPFQYVESQDFYKTAVEVIKVEMMEITGQFNYFESDSIGAKLVELRFDDESLAMIVVLPDKVSSDIALIEAHLYEVYLANSGNSFTPELVKVSLPKFKIESSIDFKPILQYLGMAKAFNSEAELDGIFQNKTEAFIDLVVQKCVINVNERGVDMDPIRDPNEKTSISSIPVPNAKKFLTADRPFMFFIKSKDLVIMTGKVVEPGT